VINNYLICDESLTCQCLNLNLGYFGSFTFILVSCGESCLLVSWCLGDRCDMTDSDEDLGRSGDLMQRTGDGQAQVGYSVAG
jgi:hypothetical protein